MMPRAIAVLAAIVLLLASDRALARCEQPARDWTAACAAEQHVELSLVGCPSGVAVLEANADGIPLRIELAHKSGGFVQVGDVAIAPIGQFEDWALEPAPRRRALEAVTACVRARAPTALLDDSRAVPRANANSARYPWLVVVGALVALLAWYDRRRALAWGLASALCVFLLRRFLVVPQFVHQNGQAPLWIDFAVRSDSAPYGPGYAELFHALVAHARRPDERLFLVQELAASIVPACAFAIARFAGARVGIAAILGVAVAIDPLVMRLARSESYFATLFTLLTIGTCLIATPTRRLGRRSLLSMVAGGCFVAAAARVHPLGWVAAATVPLVALVAPGPLRRRGVHALAGVAIIGAVVLVAAFPAMREVLRGDLAGRFLPGALSSLRRAAVFSTAAAALFAALIYLRRSRRFARRAAVLVVVVTLAVVSNVVRIDTALIASSYLHLFAPAIIGALASLTTLLPIRTSAVAITVLVAAHVSADRRALITPTDAREQAWCRTWREILPRGARVVWVERAGTRVLALPLANLDVERLPIHDDSEPSVPTTGARFYYRSSLCSTREGAPACARFESSHRLRSIERRTLPAIASQPWNGYSGAEVVVELFAIE